MEKVPYRNGPPLVSIVILNWNNLADSIECIESIKRLSYPNYRVILVDNASTGDDARVLGDRFGDSITLIRNDRNYGYAGGNAVGIARALEQNPDYVLLFQNDAIMDPRFLDEMVEACEKDRSIGMAFPVVYDYRDRAKIQFSGLKVVWGGLKTDQLWSDGDDDKPRYSILGGPGCMFLRASSLDKMRFVKATTEYFLYGDLIYSFVVFRARQKICLVPRARMWHKGGSSSVVWKSSRIRHVIKDNLVIRYRFLFGGYLWRMPPAVSTYFFLWAFVYHLPGALRFLFYNLRPRTVAASFRGLRDGVSQAFNQGKE